ncbi:MAG: endopeptidase La [Clostridia bacterium]|nr:endopeptidase La [Clostridia bacterium]
MLSGKANTPIKLPLLALRGIVTFPGAPVKLELNLDEDLAAIRHAAECDNKIFLIALKDPSQNEPFDLSDFFMTGCVAVITENERRVGSRRVTANGLFRARLQELSEDGAYCTVYELQSENDFIADSNTAATYKDALTLMDAMLKVHPSASDELKEALLKSPTPGALADSIAATLLMSFEHKQEVLDENNVVRRLRAINNAMRLEIPLIKEDLFIHRKVRAALEENQKEYYLKEQMRVIKDELGMDDDDEETAEYYDRIAAARLPKEVEEKLIKEVQKLAKTPYSSAEASVQRNYLYTVLEIPFTKYSKEQVDVRRASEILEKDHYGLEKVKERILEFVAARQLNPDLKNQTLCLVGPPGVGKTSIAASLARALNRKYVRVSLGGVRDEADIRGHRKTYVAAMPGRIITALTQAKVRNPLILLDEIDKMSNDSRGDPASAMLEVLDGEQNRAFRDHFVELPFDLSDCIFVATANSLQGVAPALIDRMEVIELASYTAEEKKQIAKRHLIPRQRERHGIKGRQLTIADSAIDAIISSYTREAGVRNLERSIAAICRKAARNIVENGAPTQRVTSKNLSDYLGHEKALEEHVYEEPLKGVVNGLAWTETGGELLRVEAVSMPGTGHIECTGNLGTVMKESAQIALSCLRSHYDSFALAEDFSKNKDIHIHFPEGATPKDGPSAGCAIYTALVSEFTGRPVRQDVAMTGEITLHGRVLPIGGLREKAMAAYKAGVHTVLIPEDNRKDLPDVDKAVREEVSFICCRSASEVLDRALL